MVQDCIIASSNMYEPPRPPRRGSHRPAPSFYPSLSDWNHSCNHYEPQHSAPVDYIRVHVSPPIPPQSTKGSAFPPRIGRGDPWTRGNVLPAKRYASATRFSHITNDHVFSTERPSLSACHQWAQERLPTTTSPSIDTHARPSLHHLRQLSGGVPDRSLVDRVIFESYVRSAPQSAACQSSQKRCMYPGCTKISVSRGLCRGHGGGRRCHVPGCTKSAQSRSNFCWAHGGGARCDADNCMRSRKSKRYCVAHLHLEDAGDDATTVKSKENASRKTSLPRGVEPTPRALPSLGQALSSASRSAPNLPARGVKLAVAS